MIDVLHRNPMPLSAFRPYGSSPLQQQVCLNQPLRQLHHAPPSSSRKQPADGELAWPRNLNKNLSDRGLPGPLSTLTPPVDTDWTNALHREQMAAYSGRPSLTHPGSSSNNTLKSLYQDQTSGDPGGKVTGASYESSTERQQPVEADYHVGKTADEIASYLQIPATINDSKGSLSDLVAQVLQASSKMRSCR